MAICCETFIVTEISGKTLIEVIDQKIDEHFFESNGLLELGWCSRYMIDKRNINYPKGSKIEKTSIVEFYWFNSSPNRFNNQQTLTNGCVCNCINCAVF